MRRTGWWMTMGGFLSGETPVEELEILGFLGTEIGPDVESDWGG